MSSAHNSLASPLRSHRDNDVVTTTPSTALSRHGQARGATLQYIEPESPITSVKNPRAGMRSPQPNSSHHYSSLHAGANGEMTPYKVAGGHTQRPAQTPSAQLFSPEFGHKSHSVPVRHPRQTGANIPQNEAVGDTELHEQEIEVIQYLSIDPAVVQPMGTRIHAYRPPCMEGIMHIFESGQLNHENLRHLLDHYHDNEVLEPYLFIRSLPPLMPSIRKSPIPVKRSDTPRITLALDLDETLAHSSITPLYEPDFSFKVNFNGMDYEVHARVRPHLEHFLKQVSQWFEIIVFTASQKVYADSILNLIDPMNEYITHRVFRDSCVCVDKNYIKDLTVLGRPLEHVIIVDNSIQAFGYHLNNGIPIESWFDDEYDYQLLDLIPLLRELKDVDDVRPYLRDIFHLQQFVDQLPVTNPTMGDR